MQKVKLDDIAEIFSGLSYRRYLDNDGNNFKIIVQRSIKKDGVCKDFEEVSLSKKIKKRYFSKENDVLMKMSYPYDVVCIKEKGIIISDKIAIIRPKNGYDPDFIAHVLTNTHINKQLYQLSTNEKIPHISLKQIKQLQLISPDFETQKKYGHLLNLINEKIKVDINQINHDRRLKQAIINDLWSKQDEIQ